MFKNLETKTNSIEFEKRNFNMLRCSDMYIWFICKIHRILSEIKKIECAKTSEKHVQEVTKDNKGNKFKFKNIYFVLF